MALPLSTGETTYDLAVSPDTVLNRLRESLDQPGRGSSVVPGLYIGETQSLVSRAAQGIGGVTMPFIGNPALRERMTALMINRVMDAQGLVVKVGLDPDRKERSEYYALELQLMLQRGYTYVVDLLPR